MANSSVKRLQNVQSQEVDAAEPNGFTGAFQTDFAPETTENPILMALELSELARILGGDLVPRPANTGHHIFLL